MRKTTRKLFVAIASAAFLQPATAGTIICEGTVEDLIMHQPGLIALRLSSMNMPLYICNINSDYKPAGADVISAATCKVTYAALLAAKYNNAVVRGVYLDGDQVPASCNTVQPASYVYLRHFAL